LTPATTQCGRGTRRPRADQHFQQSPVGRKAQVAAGSLTAASRGLTRRPPERALQARFGCLQIQRYIPLTGVPAGQKAEATGQYRGSTSHGVAGGEVRTIRPLPAHLEGDKRSTGGGLEVLVQWRNNVSSLAPVREGFASGGREIIDREQPVALSLDGGGGPSPFLVASRANAWGSLPTGTNEDRRK
jgi:hypothetical protein